MWIFIQMVIEEVEVEKGRSQDIQKRKVMENLVHDNNVIKLEINNNKCMQKIHTTWYKSLSNLIGSKNKSKLKL